MPPHAHTLPTTAPPPSHRHRTSLNQLIKSKMSPSAIRLAVLEGKRFNSADGVAAGIIDAESPMETLVADAQVRVYVCSFTCVACVFNACSMLIVHRNPSYLPPPPLLLLLLLHRCHHTNRHGPWFAVRRWHWKSRRHVRWSTRATSP